MSYYQINIGNLLVAAGKTSGYGKNVRLGIILSQAPKIRY